MSSFRKRRKYLVAGLLLGLLFFSLILFWTKKEEKPDIYALHMEFSDAFIPLVEVYVGNAKEKAYLDLGTKFCEMDFEFFPEEHVKRLEKHLKVKGIYSEENYEICKLDAIKIGNFLLRDVDFLDSKNRKFISFKIKEGVTIAEGEPLPKIILGNSVFLDKVVLFDYSKGICWIGGQVEDFFSSHLLDQTFQKISLTQSRQHFAIEAIHEKENKTFVIDTGSTWNVLMGEVDSGESVDFRPQTEEFITIDDHLFHLGPSYKVNRQLSGIDGFLGAPFLSRHLVAIDPKNKTIWVKPIDHAIPADSH